MKGEQGMQFPVKNFLEGVSSTVSCQGFVEGLSSTVSCQGFGVSWTAGPRSALLSGRHIHGGMPAHLEVLADLLNAV